MLFRSRPLPSSRYYYVENAFINPMSRPPISEPLEFGVKAIDGVNTIGKGQRIGIFAGSGVGKSTLLGMIAKNVKADINVIALVGERGREVREFVEKDLGPEGMKRSVVVVATSDQPAMLRVKCPLVATTIAEYFKDQGKDVLLMMDSLTRFAMAQREIGLATGECYCLIYIFSKPSHSTWPFLCKVQLHGHVSLTITSANPGAKLYIHM